MTLRIQTVEKDEFETVIPKLAALRINVFSDWPYLYEGSMTYEERYLRAYADSSGAVIVGAWQGTEVVGAATGAPMQDHAAEFPEPFIREGYNADEIFYFGESVLLRVFRGQGAGHAFFDLRETQAKRLGRTYACFCEVIRPIDHPKRPADYSPLHAFWRKRGYRLMEGVTATYPWKDIGEANETEKHMQFWLRELCSTNLPHRRILETFLEAYVEPAHGIFDWGKQ